VANEKYSKEYEEVKCRDERLPIDLAAPSFQHSLSIGKGTASTPTSPQLPKAKMQKVEKPVAKNPVAKNPVEGDVTTRAGRRRNKFEWMASLSHCGEVEILVNSFGSALDRNAAPNPRSGEWNHAGLTNGTTQVWRMEPRLIIHDNFTVFTARSFPDLMTAMHAEHSPWSPLNFLSLSAHLGCKQNCPFFFASRVARYLWRPPAFFLLQCSTCTCWWSKSSHPLQEINPARLP
jgi:hypothetical protein